MSLPRSRYPISDISPVMEQGVGSNMKGFISYLMLPTKFDWNVPVDMYCGRPLFRFVKIFSIEDPNVTYTFSSHLITNMTEMTHVLVSSTTGERFTHRTQFRQGDNMMSTNTPDTQNEAHYLQVVEVNHDTGCSMGILNQSSSGYELVRLLSCHGTTIGRVPLRT